MVARPRRGRDQERNIGKDESLGLHAGTTFGDTPMDSIIYIIGLIVVVLAVLSFLGLA